MLSRVVLRDLLGQTGVLLVDAAALVLGEEHANLLQVVVLDGGELGAQRLDQTAAAVVLLDWVVLERDF